MDIGEIQERMAYTDPGGKLQAQQETKSLLRHIDPNYIRSFPNSDAYREGWDRIFGAAICKCDPAGPCTCDAGEEDDE